jgi:hypothetical protein
MIVSYFRSGSFVLLTGLLLGAINVSCSAAPILTVTFGGTEAGVASPRTFTGSFVYDRGHKVSTPKGTFKFAGSSDRHQISYKIGNDPKVSGSGTGCDPYTITTSGGGKKIFELTSTVTGNKITIILPASMNLDQKELPLCDSFNSPPLTGSTFKVTGATTFNGKIDNLNCSDD